MSIQTFGLAAFRRAIANGLALAARAGDFARDSDVLELLGPVSLGIMCFRVNPAQRELEEAELDRVNRAVLANIFRDDRGLNSSTMVRGVFSLRLCIINHNTGREDAHETLSAIERFGEEVLDK